MNKIDEKFLYELFINSDCYSKNIEDIISNMIGNKKINYESSILIMNGLIKILNNCKIELDDELISELIIVDGLFVQILRCLKNNIDKINDNLILSIIEIFDEYDNVKIDMSNNNLEFFQLVDGVKEYIKSINSIPLLTSDEEFELAMKMRNGDVKARKKFIESNLRLVINIIRKYKSSELSYLDLIQEGNMALIFAVDRFDASLGYRFSTFATIIINQKVRRSIFAKGSSIRLPEYLNKKLKLVKSTHIKLYNKLGRDVTYSDIANELGMSIDEIEYLYSLQQNPISLNSKINDEEDTELLDLIQSSVNIEEEYSKKDLTDKVKELLDKSNLNAREKEILLLRYGFVDGKIWQLNDIGKIYGVTGERIR